MTLFSTLLCQEIGFPLPFFQMLVCNLYFVFICRPYKWLNLRQILPFTVYFTSWQWELHGFQRTWVFFLGGRGWNMISGGILLTKMLCQRSLLSLFCDQDSATTWKAWKLPQRKTLPQFIVNVLVGSGMLMCCILQGGQGIQIASNYYIKLKIVHW